MKSSQLASVIALLLVQSSVSFVPQLQRSFSKTRLFYSDVAERLALDTEQNVQLFDPNTHHATSLNAWKSLIPLVPGERGCDVSVTWTCPQQGALQLLEDLFPSCQQTRQKVLPQVQESFESFASLFDSPHTFKSRVVATRGFSGTKCPRWHVDHVPKRWIQALVGPGCDYISGSNGVLWECINGLDTTNVKQANLELVNENVADIRHAPQGQGVVLTGAENSAEGTFPAVHKSPTLGPFQGRVLLTIDIVREQ